MKRAIAITLLLFSIAGCTEGSGDGGSGSDCASDSDGGLDCSGMCQSYCDKLQTCGVNASTTCADDCITVTEAGASTESYTCVIQADCADVSNCGI